MNRLLCLLYATIASCGFSDATNITVQNSGDNVTFGWKLPTPYVTNITMEIFSNLDSKIRTVHHQMFNSTMTSYSTKLQPCREYEVDVTFIQHNGTLVSTSKKFWIGGKDFYAGMYTDVNITWITALRQFYNVKAPSVVIYYVGSQTKPISNADFHKYRIYTSKLEPHVINIGIMNVTTSDTGIYATVNVLTNTMTGCCRLFITDIPRKPVLNITKYPFVGDQLGIECCSPLQPLLMENNISYSFFLNDHILDPQYVISKADSGVRVYCQARDDRGFVSEMSNDIILDPFYGPDNTTLQPLWNYINITEGQPLGPIMCDADCYPECNFTWLFSSKTIQVDNPVLQIDKIDRSHTGKYQCLITHPNDTSRNVTLDLFINVQYSPSATLKPTKASLATRTSALTQTDVTYSFIEGHKIIIEMNVDSNPDPTFVIHYFSHMSTQLTFQRKPNTTFYNVFLPEWGCEKSGNYKIEVNNGIGKSLNTSVQLEIQCPPKEVIFQRQKIATQLNSVEDINIYLLAVPKPNVTWLNGSDYPWTIQTDGSSYRYSLHSKIIINRTPVHTSNGILVCNVVGCVTEYVVAVGKGKPDGVSNLTVYDISTTSASMMWIAGFDGGALQRFSVEIKSSNGIATNSSVLSGNFKAGTVIFYKLMELSAETEYLGYVVSKNIFGETKTKFAFRTQRNNGGFSIREVRILIGSLCVLIVVVIIFIARLKCIKKHSRRQQAPFQVHYGELCNTANENIYDIPHLDQVNDEYNEHGNVGFIQNTSSDWYDKCIDSVPGRHFASPDNGNMCPKVGMPGCDRGSLIESRKLLNEIQNGHDKVDLYLEMTNPTTGRNDT